MIPADAYNFGISPKASMWTASADSLVQISTRAHTACTTEASRITPMGSPTAREAGVEDEPFCYSESGGRRVFTGSNDGLRSCIAVSSDSSACIGRPRCA